ncbi:MAG: putative aminohydrolase SsnA [Clostridiaceae bacterium]
MLLIGNGTVITQDESNPFIENGCVAVDGNIIVEVGKYSKLKEKYKDAEFIDAKNNIIMPGNINSHMHIYSAYARGMVLGGEPAKNFLEILDKLWWNIDKKLTLEQVKYSALVTYIECIKNGTTTIFDHHASEGAVSGSLFGIEEAAKSLNVRSCLCYEVSDRDGKQIMEKGIKENVDFISHCNNNNNNDMIKGMFGLHASFTLSDSTLYKCRDSIQGLNTGFHIHTAEGIEDEYDCVNKYNKRVVERLKDFDILGNKTIAVHCTHVNEDEMDILKDTRTIVVHNPESNMGNAVGCAPTMEMMKKGIVMGLGTDGYTTDMYESMKVANIIHKHNLKDPRVGFLETYKMMYENNKKIAAEYFDKPLGILKKGSYADIIIIEYNPITPINKDNYFAHILFGITGKSVNTTIINGKILMKNREIQGIDEKEIYEKSRQAASNLWKII